VTPDPSGTEYQVTLDGFGSGQYVWENGDPNPVKTRVLYPGGSEEVEFPNYSPSGRLSVVVSGTPANPVVMLEPMWAGGAQVEAQVVGGTALFPAVAPGTYSIWIDGVSVDAVHVGPGTVQTKPVVVP
jgi:hypothetical protein